MYYSALAAKLYATTASLLPSFQHQSEKYFGDWLCRVLTDCTAGAMWSVIAAPPLLLAFRIKLQSHSLMLEQMAGFDFRAAKCTVESDRLLVEQQIQELFADVQTGDGRLVGSHGQDGSTSAGNSAALDSFNAAIRGPLRSAVLHSVGDELYVPYRICLTASLPLAFLSSVDTLACNEACLEFFGQVSRPLYMLHVQFVWACAIMLIFPSFYPLFLRMLKRAVSFRQQWLQVLLGVLSVIAAFDYAYFCQDTLYYLFYFPETLLHYARLCRCWCRRSCTTVFLAPSRNTLRSLPEELAIW